MTPALSERGRQVIVGSGTLVVVLLAALQPWRYVDAFVYPPHAKMFLLPFGAMPSDAAVTIWVALNLFCLFRAAELLDVGRDLALIAALAPAALIMLATGYPAGFLALMATVVITQGTVRPAKSGLCLAMMTAHPPLALLIALLLLPLPQGYWRVVAVAVAWTVALLAVSVITLGLESWTSYLGFATGQPAHGGVP